MQTLDMLNQRRRFSCSDISIHQHDLHCHSPDCPRCGKMEIETLFQSQGVQPVAYNVWSWASCAVSDVVVRGVTAPVKSMQCASPPPLGSSLHRQLQENLSCPPNNSASLAITDVLLIEPHPTLIRSSTSEPLPSLRDQQCPCHSIANLASPSEVCSSVASQSEEVTEPRSSSGTSRLQLIVLAASF